MIYKLYDEVTAVKALPDIGISAGMAGVVVDVYPDGEVEVEFCNATGETLALVPLNASQIALVEIRKAA